jgi:hypothetical protein
MDNNRFWQLLFIIGVVSLLIGTILIYGFQFYTVLITVVTTIAAFLNGLLSTKGKGDERSLMSILRGVLNEGVYLRVLTVFTWLTLIVITIINLKTDDTPKSIRIKYVDFKGYSMNLLLENEKTPLKLLNDHTEGAYKVETPIYKELRRINNFYSSQSSPYWITGQIPEDSSHIEFHYDEEDKVEIEWFSRKAIVSAYLDDYLDYPNKDYVVFPDFDTVANFIFSNISEWSYLDSPREFNDLVDLGYSSLWKYCNYDDLNRFNDNSLLFEFYLDILKKGYPEDLIPMIYGAGEECGGYDGIGLELCFPSFYVRVIEIENITEKPLSIGKFTYVLYEDKKVRKRSENDKSKGKNVSSKMFPYEELLPGEKIFIPIELILEYGIQEEESSKIKEIDYSLGGLLGGLSNSEKSFIFYEGDSVSVENEKIQKVLLNGSEFPKGRREYIYSDAIRLKKININGKNTRIRQYDPNTILIQNSGPSGSCPYIFSYNEENNEWILEDHILYGLDEKVKEDTSQIILKNFNGRLKIKEIDPETSFIDYFYLKLIDSCKNQTLIFPQSELLEKEDEKYLIMKQGDEIIYDFTKMYNYRDFEVRLISKGYYIEYINEIQHTTLQHRQ